MTELRQLCVLMIELLEKLHTDGKISNEDFEKHVKLKREMIAGK